MSMRSMPAVGGSRRYRRSVMRRVWAIVVHGAALAYGLLVMGRAAGGLAAAAGLMLGIVVALATIGLAVAAVVDGALHEAPEPLVRDEPGNPCGCCGGELRPLGSVVVCARCDRLPSHLARMHRR